MTNWTLIGQAPATSFFNTQSDESDSSALFELDKSVNGGTWVEYSSSWPHTTNHLRIASSDGAANREGGFEIGIGAAGSERSIIDMPAGDYAARDMAHTDLPITIREGERVSIKIVAAGAATLQIMITGFFDPLIRTDLRYADLMGKIGTDAYTEPDPGGTIHTKGAWLELKDVTANDYKSLLLCFATSNISDGETVELLFDIAIGASASEVVFLSNVYVQRADRTVFKTTRQYAINCQIPAGVRLSVRAQANNIEAAERQQVGLGIIGLY